MKSFIVIVSTATDTPRITTVSMPRKCIKLNLISSKYAASRAKAVNAALPIANPLPVAAVVLPTASNSSVRCRTSGSSPAISALPPALSAIGPYASAAKVIPRVESIATAANPTPYNPISVFSAPPEK